MSFGVLRRRSKDKLEGRPTAIQCTPMYIHTPGFIFERILGAKKGDSLSSEVYLCMFCRLYKSARNFFYFGLLKEARFWLGKRPQCTLTYTMYTWGGGLQG